MALPVFITLTVTLMYVCIFMGNKLTFLQNTIVFMTLAIISKNYLTVMTMELKLLKSSEDQLLFMSYILYREMIIPLLILIYTNACLLSSSWRRKAVLFVAGLFLLEGMNYIAVVFKVIEYVKWTYFWEGIVDAAYLGIGLGLAKGVLYFQEKEKLKHDSRL